MSGWSWYDRRSGERLTEATFISYQAAVERLNYWRGRDLRSDLAHLVDQVEVREIEHD